jgi:hypothetical protein
MILAIHRTLAPEAITGTTHTDSEDFWHGLSCRAARSPVEASGRALYVAAYARQPLGRSAQNQIDGCWTHMMTRLIRGQISPLRSAARTSGRNDRGRGAGFRSGAHGLIEFVSVPSWLGDWQKKRRSRGHSASFISGITAGHLRRWPVFLSQRMVRCCMWWATPWQSVQ